VESTFLLYQTNLKATSNPSKFVVLVKAGVSSKKNFWIPPFAGMTP